MSSRPTSRMTSPWYCKYYKLFCDEFPEVTPTTIPSTDCSNSKSIIVSWNEIAPIVVVGLLICILVFLILNLRKKVHRRSERAHRPGYGIPITLVEEGVVNFAAQPQFVKNAH
ncbi:hypothetical protein Ddc_24578 [Ditylenchus destructor]|nr:hypothetical protein Ddc_24578 [Ditylenchus destructor]